MRFGDLPPDLLFQRTTNEFDAATVPSGLLRSHQLAPGVWGVLDVVAGILVFVWEDRPEEPVGLAAGDSLVIHPEVLHHVEPGPGAQFHVSFYRSPETGKD